MFLELLNMREITLTLPEGSTLKTAIDIIDSKFNPNFSKILLDDKGMIREGSYVILLNGSAIRENDPSNIKLSDEDIIAILPTAVGGKRLKGCNQRSIQ